MEQPLTLDERDALAALGRDELSTFARLHQRCVDEAGPDNRKLLSTIITTLPHLSFDQLDELITRYHDNFFPLGSNQAPSPVGPAEQLVTLHANPKEPIYCPVCKTYLNGRTQYEDHCGGKKHLKKAATPAINADDYWGKWKLKATASSQSS